MRHWPIIREGLAHYGTALLALNWMTALHERWMWRAALADGAYRYENATVLTHCCTSAPSHFGAKDFSGAG